MRSKRVGLKPEQNSIERFKRTSRITHHISRVTATLKGSPSTKAERIALTVLRRLPIDESIEGVEKKRIFRRTAEHALLKKRAIGPLHCAERCNLAIALLNASGVKAWLARVFVTPKVEGSNKLKWHFHDFVEFVEEGRVKTLVFDSLFVPKGVADRFNYDILSGTINSVFPKNHSFVFRAADSKQIGGVGNWNEYKKYSKRLDTRDGLVGELAKNKRRIDLLIKEGIIPKEVMGEM